MVINILQNLSHIYFSHHIIIKYVDFKSFHCVINLDATSSSRVYTKFNSMFLSNVLLV